MTQWTSYSVEVIVRVEPARRLSHQKIPTPDAGEELPFSNEGTESYDLFIYGTSNAGSHLQKIQRPEGISGQPEELVGLPIFGLETVVFHSDSYREYLFKALLTPHKAIDSMLSRDSLFGPLSPGLRQLFRTDGPDQASLRIWWDTPTIGLMDIPWEILVYPTESGNISFVRGLPPEQKIPKTLVGEKLRLALIHDPKDTDCELSQTLKEISGLQVVEMTDTPRESLRNAIRDGFEMIHLVSDGSVSLAFEGLLHLSKSRLVDVSADIENFLLRVLLRQVVRLYDWIERYLPDDFAYILGKLFYKRTNAETLTAAELSFLQRGSRLTVLGLSAPSTSSEGRFGNVMSYRAFAYVGGAKLPLPSIVAPIEMIHKPQECMFWKSFYEQLCLTKSVEQAMLAGMSTGKSLPMALFLRQQSAQTFEEREAQKNLNLALLSAELQQSLKTLELLRAAKRRQESLTEIVDDFEQREMIRQRRLLAELKPWLGGEQS